MANIDGVVYGRITPARGRVVKENLPVLPEYANVVVKPRARDYLVGGVAYARVTTALGIINKPALVPWAARTALAKVREVLVNPDVYRELARALEETPESYEEFVDLLIDRAAKAPNEARDARGEAGTEVHSLISEVVALDDIDRSAFLMGSDAPPAVWEALRFLSDYGIKVIDTERVVWLPDLKVAGTIDGIGMRNGHVVIWDWKTSASVYWETALQLGAYAKLLTRLTGVGVAAAFAVRLPRPGDGAGYEAKELSADSLRLAWEAYLSALRLKEYSREEWWEDKEGNT